MKKNTKLILLICVLAVVAAATCLLFIFKDALFSVPAKESYSFINPDETRAETDTGMKIDGVFDESVYSQNTWTYLHNANGGNTVDLAVTSYFGEKGIYFAYEVRESTPIYVNMDRATWMNSCIEMYLVPSDVEKMPSENIFEIDLLPTGYLLFKRPNAAGGWSDVSTTNDKMAYLGANPYGGEVNTDACTGYDLELFIPYDYLELLGVDSQLVKDGYVNVNPCHITSYNEDGTDGSVDRFWYSFGKQLGGDGWNDVNRYFKFNKNGAMGTVPNEFEQGENCTLSGKPNAIPGQNTMVTVTPDAGYALSSIVCNEEEMIHQVDYNEDGSVTLTLRATNEGFRFTAEAEPITEGNKNISGIVELKNLFGDTLEGVSASYEDASGQHKLELAADGRFLLENVPQGYYVINVKKDGYLKVARKLCVNRDLDIVVEVPYDLFETESGNCWKTENANAGVLTKINGQGAILTKDLFGDFYAEANFCYSEELAKEFPGDDYQQQRMGVRVKFDNGKYWHIDLLRQNDGKYHLQFGKILGADSLFDWDLVHELTQQQIEQYQSEDGIKIGVLRAGKTAYIYLDDQFVGQADLGFEQAQCKAQIGFESFVANGKVMTVLYDLDVNTPAKVLLTDSGCVGAAVSLDGDYQVGKDVTILIRKITSEVDAQLLSVQVNGREMAQDAIAVADGYKLTIQGNQEKILSVKAIYAKPSLKTAVIDIMDSAADGVSVRLLQDGAVKANAVIHNGKAVFADIYQGTYEVQVRIFNVWTTLGRVTVLDEEQVQVDIKILFETADNTNYSADITFQGSSPRHYSIATDISGDAWFAMKVQVDKAQLDAVAANKGNIRLGYRMFFGGYEGNYEWDNEYEITLKYTPEGNWVLEQMQTWQSYALSTEMVEALTADGLYLALKRDGQSGVLTLYCGSTEKDLLSGAYSCTWETASEKQKENIKRFGVGFWSENGSNYKATVSDLRYGASLSELFNMEAVTVELQLLGHKNGDYTALPKNTQVLVQNALGNYQLTVDDNGKISSQMLPGSYSVSVVGYAAAEVEIPASGLQGQLTLEYDLFHCPTGWDTEKHDLSEVNDSTPSISMSGGTMNVLTNDSFNDVSASLWVKKSNSNHPAHTQGIWIRFEDGKYMILYQEDAKLAYMQNLWDFETVQNTYKVVCESLPEATAQKWEADGYQLSLLRKDNQLYVTADGMLYDVETLPEEYADDLVQVGFFAYDSADLAVWDFEITSQIPDFENGTVDGQIVSNIPVENGTAIRLLKDGAIAAEGIFSDNRVCLDNIIGGQYDAEIMIFGYWAKLATLNILNSMPVTADVAALFENAELADFDGNIQFAGTATQHYSVAADISGDAWFAMKVQIDKSQLDAVAANKGNIRLGYRMFFGGYKGNYEWDNEYEITLKYTPEGNWVLEQMQTWQSAPVPEQMVDALTADGLYLALHRNAETGMLTLYCGSTEEQLQVGNDSFKWETATEKQKENITRFGAGFWSENGASYKATVSELRYGTSFSELFNIETVTMELQLQGHKNGSCSLLPEGTEVLLQSAAGHYQLTVDADGKISGQVLSGSYSVFVDGYAAAEVEIPVSGLQGQLTVEYDLFHCPTGWDTEKHDLSKVNDSTPSISMSGGTMNVLTNDSFNDVSASLWVKKSNSNHSAHTQGIWIRFEDGKHMILYQEDAKLAYMQNLWDFETVQNTYKAVCESLPEATAQKWEADGYQLSLLRKDNQLYVTADGMLYDVETLPEEYADDLVQIGFFAYDSADPAVWDFEILSDISAFYVVCKDSENGTVTANKESVQLGETVTLTVTPATGYVLNSLKVNGIECVAQVLNGKLNITVAGDLTVEATFAYGYVDAEIVPNISVEDGTAIRLLQDGQIKAEGSFVNDSARLEDVFCGEYDAEVQVFGYWAKLGTIHILGGNAVEADVAALFETADQSNYTGNIAFTGTSSRHYSIATDISGDAWFAMKVQVDKTQIDAVAANKGNVRLGYRMFFGGETGNYLWDNEYEITLKYTSEGNWVLEQMQTWQSAPIPEQMVDALTADGLYLALHRNAVTGVLTLYCGSTEEQLLVGNYSFEWAVVSEKQKENITRFGAGFWSENGSDYKATVSDLRYGTSLSALLGIEEAEVSLQLSGHRNGGYSLLPEGTEVLLQNAAGVYQLTVDADGKINGQVLSGNYRVSTDGYTAAEVEIPASGLQGTLTLEYDLFYCPTGWDTEKHDLSKVNDSNPGISMSGGTMNVLTNDSFNDVSASLWVKESNSNHSAHTQGIWIRFEDGKYMILYQEDAKLAYMQNLWDFETVQNAYEVVCESLPEEILNKWTSDGYELCLIRKENRLFVTADGQLYHTQNLPEEYADDLVQIGFFAYDSAVDAQWNFAIESEFTACSIVCNESENGTVTADKTSARLGETVTLTATPQTGYLLKSLMVNGQERIQDVIDGVLSVTVLEDVTVDAIFESAYINGMITSNIPVEDGTAIRLLQNGSVVAKSTFNSNRAVFENIIGGEFDAEILVFGYWAKLTSLNILSNDAVIADVAALFENPEFTDFDGNISFGGTAIKHSSVATDITGDAWFTMKVQVDRAQLNAAAANKGNIRLGYRLFFGGESGNYLWENEFEPTLKYNAEGRWVVEQMNSWEGWDHYLSDEMVTALTGNGLYLALHRNAQSGVLTLYYGATQAELLAQSNRFVYSQMADKQKENITRFGAGFWSENGSDYQATVTNLRYSTSLQESMETFVVTLNAENVPDSTVIRLTQNGKECVSGVVQNEQVVFDAVVSGSYQVEVKIYGAWSPVTSVNVADDTTAELDVLSVFENRDFTDFDGDISFTGTTGRNYSVATDISGDAWFAMKLQIDKAKLDAVAANKGNIRLGFRMFFGGEPGNSGWENEYELTLKYTAEGRWIVEQMQSWEGWNYYLSQDAIDALTGDGLYIAMHRNVQTGVLTLYYGASRDEILSNSFTYSQAASKHKENITRFGVAFWSEKGSDYTVAISDLCYGATMEDATQQMQ